MRVVLDTNVIVAALRSPTGASAELVRRVLTGEPAASATTALLLEQQAVATRAEHLKAANLSESAVLEVIGALAVAMEPVPILWRMRPNSPDPDDDFVIEAAVNAGAQILVTDNRRDLGEACATLGIRTLSPGMLLMELRRSE